MIGLPLVFVAIIVGAGLLFILAAIFMQEVRSKLVRVLIAQKSPLSAEVSDWSVSGGRLPGHYGAINKEFIWGAKADQLLQQRETAPLLRVARVLYVVREVARYAGFAGLVGFAWAFAVRA